MAVCMCFHFVIISQAWLSKCHWVFWWPTHMLLNYLAEPKIWLLNFFTPSICIKLTLKCRSNLSNHSLLRCFNDRSSKCRHNARFGQISLGLAFRPIIMQRNVMQQGPRGSIIVDQPAITHYSPLSLEISSRLAVALSLLPRIGRAPTPLERLRRGK